MIDTQRFGHQTLSHPWPGGWGRIVILLAWLSVLPALGCAEMLGPEPMPTAMVRGQVRIGDQPVQGGWLEFMPTEGTVGRLRSARIQADGAFAADGVAVGTNAVRVVGAPLPGDPNQFAMLRHLFLMRRQVPEQGAEDLDIDLAQEHRRLSMP